MYSVKYEVRERRDAVGGDNCGHLQVQRAESRIVAHKDWERRHRLEIEMHKCTCLQLISRERKELPYGSLIAIEGSSELIEGEQEFLNTMARLLQKQFGAGAYSSVVDGDKERAGRVPMEVVGVPR